MKYLLKLASGEGKGYFEAVNKFAFDNYKSALADDGETPRYEENSWVMVRDDGTLAIQLHSANPQDIAILMRALQLPQAPLKVDGGFIREPVTIMFKKGSKMTLLQLATGREWNLNTKKKVA